MRTLSAKVPKLVVGNKNFLKEQVLGPSIYFLVGITLNLTYKAPTQAWLYPLKC